MKQILKERYELTRKLGRPKTSQSWVAKDRANKGKHVAIRLIHPDRSNPTLARKIIDRTKALFLLSHPGLLPLIDASRVTTGSRRGSILLASEMNDGKSLDLLRPKLKQEQILQIFAQLLETLHYLHGQGIVHGHIRPENLIISMRKNEPLQLKLANWAVCHCMALQHELNSDERPAWLSRKKSALHESLLAPETKQGRFPSASSDLFQVGALIYYCLTGNALPDDEGDRTKALQKSRDDYPDGFWLVLEKLLKKRSAFRYKRAEQALAALRRWVIHNQDLTTSTQQKPLLGRTQPLKVFKEAIESIATGDAKAPLPLMSLSGELGLGKTSLLAHMKQWARDNGYRTKLLSSDAGQDRMQPLLRGLLGDEVDLENLISQSRAHNDDSRRPSDEALWNRVLDCLNSDEASSTFSLLLCDDFHLWDAAEQKRTMDMLSYLCAHEGQKRFAVILASESVEASLKEWLPTSEENGEPVVRFELKPLSLELSEQLLDSLVKDAHLIGEVRSQLLELARGNPLLIHEGFEHCQEKGYIYLDAMRAAAKPQSLNQDDLAGGNLYRLMGSRLSRASKTQLSLARQLAYLQMSITVDELQSLKLTTATKASLLKEIDQLIEIKVLKLDDEQLYFAHPAIRQSLLSSTPNLKDKQRIHTSLFKGIKKLNPEAKSSLYLEMLIQGLEAESTQIEASDILLAASWLDQEFRYAELSTLLEAALRWFEIHGEQQPEVWHLHESYVDVLIRGGRNEDAQNHLTQVFATIEKQIAQADAPVHSAYLRLLEQAVRGYRYLGQYDDAETMLAKALDYLEDHPEDERWINFRAWQANLFLMQGLYAQALEAIDTTIDERELELSPAWIQLHLYKGHAHSMLGDASHAREQYDWCVEKARAISYYPGLANALQSQGLLDLNARKLSSALKYFEEASELFQTIGFVSGATACKFSIARIHFDQARFELAMHMMSEVMNTYRSINNRRETANALLLLGRIASDLGFHDQALSHFESALWLCEKQRMHHLRGLCHLSLLYHKLWQKRDSEAEWHLKQAEVAAGKTRSTQMGRECKKAKMVLSAKLDINSVDREEAEALLAELYRDGSAHSAAELSMRLLRLSPTDSLRGPLESHLTGLIDQLPPRLMLKAEQALIESRQQTGALIDIEEITPFIEELERVATPLSESCRISFLNRYHYSNLLTLQQTLREGELAPKKSEAESDDQWKTIGASQLQGFLQAGTKIQMAQSDPELLEVLASAAQPLFSADSILLLTKQQEQVQAQPEVDSSTNSSLRRLFELADASAPAFLSPDLAKDVRLTEIDEKLPSSCVAVATELPGIGKIVLVVMRGTDQGFQSSHAFTLKQLAIHVASAMERMQLARQLKAAPKGVEAASSPAPQPQITEPVATKNFKSKELVFHGENMKTIIELVPKLAASTAPLLIEGESGTGKELLAKIVHDSANQESEAPFVTVNCGAIRDELFESEFFGHVRGAFSGAVQNRVGFMQAADGGTLFLDEVSHLTEVQQVKLLRALQEKEVRPVGSNATIPVELRVIAATNRDLEELVRKGMFRLDLYYRLNVFHLEVPALRERREDISALVKAFIAKHRPGAELTLSEDALQMLTIYPWPGNVRELENEIERLVFMEDLTSEIPAESLADRIQSYVEGMDLQSLGGFFEQPGMSLSKRLRELEHKIITEALARNDGNIMRTAKDLKIGRANLKYRMKKLLIGN